MVQQPTNEFQLVLKALSYLRTHWFIFAVQAVLVALVAVYRFQHTDPVYESFTSLLIDASRRNIYQSVITPGQQTMGGNARKQNITYLLTSQDVLERLRTNLYEYYNAEGKPAFLKEFFPNGKAKNVRALKGSLTMSWDKNSDIYNIKCYAGSPLGAYSLCLLYLNTIQIAYPEIGQRESLLKKDFLSKQIVMLTRQVEEKEQYLSDFQKEKADFINFLVVDPENKAMQVMQKDANDLNQLLVQNRALKKMMTEIPSSRKGEYIARSRSIDAISVRITELRYQRDLVNQAKNDPERYSKMRLLEKEIESLQNQLGGLNDEDVRGNVKMPVAAIDVRKRVSELELEYRTNLIRYKGLLGQISEMKRKGELFQGDRLKYERLQSDLINRRKLLNNLFVKEQETELELSAGSAEVFRLQEPSKNSFRTSPQLARFIYGSISIFVFFLVISLVLLMAFLPRLDSEAEVNRLNLPVLGKVPVIRGTGNFEEMPSLGFEFLKIMNYRILRETKDLKCPIIVVGSSHSREGKSTVSQLLALASQAPGRKTLMIDGDLLTAHPTKFFGIDDDQSPGLKAIVEGKLVTNPQAAIVRTVHEGIHFMPRGGRLEPTASPNFLDPVKKCLELMRKDYDIIIVDTPPLFAANLAYQWAGLANLIVLVARIFVTKPKDIIEALQTCKVFSKAPIGIALNCVPLTGQAKKVSNYYFSNRKHRPTRLAA